MNNNNDLAESLRSFLVFQTCCKTHDGWPCKDCMTTWIIKQGRGKGLTFEKTCEILNKVTLIKDKSKLARS